MTYNDFKRLVKRIETKVYIREFANGIAGMSENRYKEVFDNKKYMLLMQNYLFSRYPEYSKRFLREKY